MSIASKKIPKHLYHLSDENHNNEVFYPRVPKTITYDEDVKTKRICFSSSMSGAFRAHFNYRTGWIIKYVHIPIRPINEKYLKKPTIKEVPDIQDTGEWWCTRRVKLKCIGKVKMRENLKEIFFIKSNNSKNFDHELYSIDIKWIEKY